MKVTEKDGAVKIAPDHPDMMMGQLLLMEAIGTHDFDFCDGLISQLANVDSRTGEGGLNFMLAMVKGSNLATRWRRCSRSKWRQSIRNHDVRASPSSSGEHAPTRQRGACTQQAAPEPLRRKWKHSSDTEVPPSRG